MKPILNPPVRIGTLGSSPSVALVAMSDAELRRLQAAIADELARRQGDASERIVWSGGDPNLRATFG